MAKPLTNITKTFFINNYNIVEVLNDVPTIMQKLQTLNSNNQVVAFAVKKKHKATLEDVIERLDKIEQRLSTVEDKLVRNNIN